MFGLFNHREAIYQATDGMSATAEYVEQAMGTSPSYSWMLEIPALCMTVSNEGLFESVVKGAGIQSCRSLYPYEEVARAIVAAGFARWLSKADMVMLVAAMNRKIIAARSVALVKHEQEMIIYHREVQLARWQRAGFDGVDGKYLYEEEEDNDDYDDDDDSFIEQDATPIVDNSVVVDMWEHARKKGRSTPDIAR